jgi:hypothetical protein
MEEVQNCKLMKWEIEYDITKTCWKVMLPYFFYL